MTGIVRYPDLSVLCFALSLTCLSISEPVFSQETLRNNPVKSKSDSARLHSLYAGADYGSNMIWLGSTISGSLPYYSASLTYGFKNSFYLSGSASNVSGLKPYPAFYSLSADYSHTFNDWFDISADLAGYKTRKTLQDTLFSDFGYANLTAGFDWKILYTRVSLSGVLSSDNKGYIQILNSRYFQTGDFLKGEAFISFNPGFNLLAGEIIEIITTTTGSKRYGLSPPFRHYKKNPLSSVETYTSTFGVMDYELSFPVTFNYKNLSFEVEPDYIIPAYKNSTYPAPHGFLVYLSLYLKIY